MRRLPVLALLVSLPSFVPSFVAAGEPVMELAESSVLVSGVAPGHRVVLLGVGQEMRAFLPVDVHLLRAGEADPTGVVELDLGRPVPERSVWVVVDATTGEFALAAHGTDLREVDFPSRGLGAQRRWLEDERRFLRVLLVRPDAAGTGGAEAAATEESGAWSGRFGDGGEADLDGSTDGRVRLGFSSLRPVVGELEPPAMVGPDDLLVAIDPGSLEIYAARLVEAGQ